MIIDTEKLFKRCLVENKLGGDSTNLKKYIMVLLYLDDIFNLDLYNEISSYTTNILPELEYELIYDANELKPCQMRSKYYQENKHKYEIPCYAEIKIDYNYDGDLYFMIEFKADKTTIVNKTYKIDLKFDNDKNKILFNASINNRKSTAILIDMYIDMIINHFNIDTNNNKFNINFDGINYNYNSFKHFIKEEY